MTDALRVAHEDLDVNEDRLVTWNKEPFTGTALEQHGDGHLKSETAYVQGVRHGASREWHRTGAKEIKQEATYWHGARHGNTSTFDAAGRRLADETYEFGVLTRKRRWASNGELAHEWTIGPADDLYRILQLSREKWGSLGDRW
jgi:antitoxin component YwqK of YwqJK toxin-antitoxin module